MGRRDFGRRDISRRDIRRSDLRNGSAEIGDVGDPSEELLDIENCGLLNEVRPQMMGGVFEDDAEIFEMESVAQR
jgi:hypothetical protein